MLSADAAAFPTSPGVYAGLRASGQKGDLSLVVADAPATAAGVFTKNVMCAAPVLYCKHVLERTSTVRAVSG
jgi:glutamate N-acetyltransferase/amino-acid N-acetyltransferase